MKFARCRIGSKVRPVVITADGTYDLSARLEDLSPATLSALAEVTDWIATGSVPEIDLDGADYLAPVTGVGSVIAVGLNYAAHAAESGVQPPSSPVIFLKTPNTVAAPNGAFRIPARSVRTDWEVELAMIIGRRAYELGEEEDPLDYVAGFTVANDISERAFQIDESGGQWSKGKCLPGSTPIGPWLVTRDELDLAGLRLRSWVNDAPRQDSSTADMIFDPTTIVRHLSQYVALEPGDLVLTGTPEGVALSGRFPYLKPGDLVRLSIDGLGEQQQLMSAGDHGKGEQ